MSSDKDEGTQPKPAATPSGAKRPAPTPPEPRADGLKTVIGNVLWEPIRPKEDRSER